MDTSIDRIKLILLDHLNRWDHYVCTVEQFNSLLDALDDLMLEARREGAEDGERDAFAELRR